MLVPLRRSVSMPVQSWDSTAKNMNSCRLKSELCSNNDSISDRSLAVFQA